MIDSRQLLKRLARSVFRRIGLDVRSLNYVNSEDTVVKSLLHLVKPAVVLDVGANIGQYAKRIRASGYRNTIISFEAVPSVHARLVETAGGDPDWIVAPCGALGSESRNVEINISANTVSSSLLPMKEVHRRAAPQSTYVGKQTVSMRRLDEAIAGLITSEGDLFLKIDTQGYEKEVLRGASSLMARIAVLQLELSLTPLYENAPTFSEMVSFTEGLGYELFSLVPGFQDGRTGRLFQVDGFFLRRAMDN